MTGGGSLVGHKAAHGHREPRRASVNRQDDIRPVSVHADGGCGAAPLVHRAFGWSYLSERTQVCNCYCVSVPNCISSTTRVTESIVSLPGTSLISTVRIVQAVQLAPGNRPGGSNSFVGQLQVAAHDHANLGHLGPAVNGVDLIVDCKNVVDVCHRANGYRSQSTFGCQRLARSFASRLASTLRARRQYWWPRKQSAGRG